MDCVLVMETDSEVVVPQCHKGSGGVQVHRHYRGANIHHKQCQDCLSE